MFPRTAVKDRIVAFLLFLGKIVIVCLVGKSLVCATNTLLHYRYVASVCVEYLFMYMYLLCALQVS